MRKYLFSLVMLVALLSACAQKEASLVEVKHLPDKVEKAIDPEEQLQVVNNSGGFYYIIFQSDADVKTALQTKDDMAIVQLEESPAASSESKRTIYKLTTGPEHEKMDIRINGESASYPVIIVN